MRENSGKNAYHTEIQIDKLPLLLGVHAENPPHKPRIRWKIENAALEGDTATIRVPPDRSDFWKPYATLDVAEPRLVFGRAEDPRPGVIPEPRMIDAEERETITLPDELASDLRNRLEELGTVAENDQIGEDPSAFPSSIQSVEPLDEPTQWEPTAWEPDRKVMWYADQKSRFPERSYQLEADELIWRRFDLKNSENVSRRLVDSNGEIESSP